MKEMTIKELAAHLQKRIDDRLKVFYDHNERLKKLHIESEELEKKMVSVIVELEPVESLIYNQNPHLEKLFESLKRIYIKDDNGFNNEIN